MYSLGFDYYVKCPGCLCDHYCPSPRLCETCRTELPYCDINVLYGYNGNNMRHLEDLSLLDLQRLMTKLSACQGQIRDHLVEQGLDIMFKEWARRG